MSIRFLALMAALLLGGAGPSAFGAEVVVTGDRVNLRAKASDQSEVVAQVSNGAKLTVKSMGEEWVELLPPPSVSLWVHRDMVKDGVATASKLNVRAGPGINYSIVARLAKGERVNVRGPQGEWLEVDPVPGSSVWVNRRFVKPVQTAPAPLPQTSIESKPKPRPPASPPPPPPTLPAQEEVKPAPPEELVRRGLVPLEGQGLRVQAEGVLRPPGYLLGPPSRYRLVVEEGGDYYTVCYIWGEKEVLDPLMGKKLLVVGRQYYLKMVRDPVVVPEKITIRD